MAKYNNNNIIKPKKKKRKVITSETNNINIIKNNNINNNNIVIKIIFEMITWKLKMDNIVDNKSTFRHLATFWYGNKKYNKYNIISENSLRESRNGCNYSSHAEMDALKHLPPLYLYGRKKRVIDLIVIRIDKNGIMKNSTPCFMCIKHMQWMTLHTSYKIQNIYYSYDDNIVVVKKLTDLINSNDKHISRRFKKK